MSFGLPDLPYLMTQLGPTMPEVATIIQHDIDHWEIVFDGGIRLQLHWQAQPPRVQMRCAMRPPNASDREHCVVGDYDLSDGSLPELRARIYAFLSGVAPVAADAANDGTDGTDSAADHVANGVAARNRLALPAASATSAASAVSSALLRPALPAA